MIRPKSMATVVSFLRDRVLVGDALLGREHRDLADGADQGGLAGCERAGHDDLDRGAQLRGVACRVATSQPPDAGDESQQQALVHAGVPFDRVGRWRGSGGDPATDCGRSGSGCSGARCGMNGSGRCGVTVDRSRAAAELASDLLDAGAIVASPRRPPSAMSSTSASGSGRRPARSGLRRQPTPRLPSAGRWCPAPCAPARRAAPAGGSARDAVATVDLEQAPPDELGERHDHGVLPPPAQRPRCRRPTGVPSTRASSAQSSRLTEGSLSGARATARMASGVGMCFVDRGPGLEPAAGLGDDVVDLAGDADVVDVGLVDWTNSKSPSCQRIRSKTVSMMCSDTRAVRSLARCPRRLAGRVPRRPPGRR